MDIDFKVFSLLYLNYLLTIGDATKVKIEQLDASCLEFSFLFGSESFVHHLQPLAKESEFELTPQITSILY